MNFCVNIWTRGNFLVRVVHYNFARSDSATVSLFQRQTTSYRLSREVFHPLLAQRQ